MNAALVKAGDTGLRVLAYAALAALFWTILASLVFLWLTGMLSDPAIAPMRRPFIWWVGLRAALAGRMVLDDMLYLAVSAVGPLALFSVGFRFWLRLNGGLRGVAQSMGIYRITRSSSHTHGAADWMPMAEVQKLLPPEPEEEIGGVVLGEAVRMDLTPVAKVRFNPKKPETWGPGGRVPLLFDHCSEGSTHGIVMVNSGGFKTMSGIVTLDYWKTGAFIFDPSEEIADMTKAWRERMGHKVHILDPMGGVGTNVVRWIAQAIKANNPLSEVFLSATVERSYGKTPPAPGQSSDNAAYFREQGRNLFTALLAHVLWDPELPMHLKTLRMAKRLLSQPEAELRQTLLMIYETSESRLARDLAAPLFDLTKVTFDGIRSNAAQGTSWLGIETFASMVSNDDFDLTDLANGRTTVYCQISMDALEAYPEVARAVGSAALNTVIQAKGRVKGRVWYWIDEADLWGAMGALTTVRDRGRKYKMTLCLNYQSEGLLRAVWGDRASSWFSGVTWLMYGVQTDLDTARNISARLGTYGAKVVNESESKGRSGKAMEIGTRSTGSSTSTNETKRELMMAHELLQDLRTDERILFYLGARPMRIRACPAFCRPEIRKRIGATSFQPKEVRETEEVV